MTRFPERSPNVASLLESLKKRVERIVSPTEPEWRAFLDSAVRKVVPKGQCLWREGDSCQHLAFLTTGVFRYFALKDGRDISLQFMFAGNFFVDYPSFVNEEPIRFYYEALQDAELILLPRTTVYAAIHRYPVWERFARIMSEHNAVQISKRKNTMLFDSPKEQYLGLLRERPKVFQLVPQHMIATYLGITPEHLSRIRRSLRDD